MRLIMIAILAAACGSTDQDPTDEDVPTSEEPSCAAGSWMVTVTYGDGTCVAPATSYEDLWKFDTAGTLVFPEPSADTKVDVKIESYPDYCRAEITIKGTDLVANYIMSREGTSVTGFGDVSGNGCYQIFDVAGTYAP